MPLTQISLRRGKPANYRKAIMRGVYEAMRAALVVLAACAATAPALAAPPCGVSTSDWCEAPPGDACGAHRDAAACRADARCTAMPYRGESVVACIYDGRGFPQNCPSVGCISVENRKKMRQ